MRAVIQRVSQAEVRVDGNVTGRIGRGFLILLGVAVGDTDIDLNWMVEKVIHLRIFPNEEGKFDRSLLDIHGQVLLVSQFTLFGDCRKGRRPGFTDAAPPEIAEPVFKRA
ncbi:MAG: D-tyrosyl-tRNA(Tyr) deacylase, partial [Candidatus Omnitrophica bacterium]|nr:D-tyrosyl-tRNA(Tyr) deacylase [Candidatus Omnitrophota bacterium]